MNTGTPKNNNLGVFYTNIGKNVNKGLILLKMHNHIIKNAKTQLLVVFYVQAQF